MTFEYEFVDLFTQTIPPHVVQEFPRWIIESTNSVPIASSRQSVTVAVVDPEDLEMRDKVRFVFNRNVSFVATTQEALEYAFRKYWGES